MERLHVWDGRLPTVVYFREIGCRAFVLNKAPTKGKLDRQQIKRKNFCGVCRWLPDSRKIEIKRDVKFMESDQKFFIEKNIKRNWFDVDIAKKSVEEVEPQPEPSFEKVFKSLSSGLRRPGRLRIIRNRSSGTTT